MTDVFDALLQEVAFTQFERQAILLANLQAAFEGGEKLGLINGVEENVVDDDAVAGVLGSGISGFE